MINTIMQLLDNKYTKHYNLLVEKCKVRIIVYDASLGHEKHHIIPKCFGGSNKKDNLVVFTAREHCIAHMLLAKMYEGIAKAKMIFALKSMMYYRNKHRATITSKQYELLRIQYQNQRNDPAYKKWRSDITKKQWTPERRAAVAAKAREQWATGIKREIFSSQEYKDKKSRQMLERWQQEDYIKEMSNRALQQHNDGNFGKSSRKK